MVRRQWSKRFKVWMKRTFNAFYISTIASLDLFWAIAFSGSAESVANCSASNYAAYLTFKHLVSKLFSVPRISLYSDPGDVLDIFQSLTETIPSILNCFLVLIERDFSRIKQSSLWVLEGSLQGIPLLHEQEWRSS